MELQKKQIDYAKTLSISPLINGKKESMEQRKKRIITTRKQSIQIGNKYNQTFNNFMNKINKMNEKLTKTNKEISNETSNPFQELEGKWKEEKQEMIKRLELKQKHKKGLKDKLERERNEFLDMKQKLKSAKAQRNSLRENNKNLENESNQFKYQIENELKPKAEKVNETKRKMLRNLHIFVIFLI